MWEKLKIKAELKFPHANYSKSAGSEQAAGRGCEDCDQRADNQKEAQTNEDLFFNHYMI